MRETTVNASAHFCVVWLGITTKKYNDFEWTSHDALHTVYFFLVVTCTLAFYLDFFALSLSFLVCLSASLFFRSHNTSFFISSLSVHVFVCYFFLLFCKMQNTQRINSSFLFLNLYDIMQFSSLFFRFNKI